MQRAKPGDRVAVEYIGTLDNGKIFDSRDQADRLEIVLGRGEVFAALEEQIVGMCEGEVKNIVIPPERAYGPRRTENILKLHRSFFPVEREMHIGQKLSLQFSDGQERIMLIVGLGDETVTLDGNHSLAGCELTFALKLALIH